MDEMEFGETLVAMTAILTGGVAIISIVAMRARRAAHGPRELMDELRAVRAEIAALRSQNSDIILQLDAGAGRTEERIERLELSLRQGEQEYRPALREQAGPRMMHECRAVGESLRQDAARPAG